jgi:CBS domain-containing protein
MTAGAVGSLFGQLFRLSDAERSTMLVAGAAAGMTGVFATPLSAVLLAVELLLFEWRPRSLVPVAVAASTAGVLRRYLLGAGPLFPMTSLEPAVQPLTVLAAVTLGVIGGLAALVLSRAVYASEDFFEHHLPIHWMWWPAVGGVVIGVGGFIFPRALGTGYDVIASLIGGNVTWSLIFGVLLIKSIIWSFSLGSGTSGGILAPLLMIGGALGALFAHVLPAAQTGAWPLVGMAAVLSGAIGCPLTSAVLAMELTHDYGLLLPLLAGSVAAHAITVLLQRRSILTERLSRRGHHLSREYGVDPLETMTAAKVMQTEVVVLPQMLRVTELEGVEAGESTEAVRPRRQRLYPVSDMQGRLVGVVTRRQLREFAEEEWSVSARAVPYSEAEVCFPDETLRSLAERMASSGFGAMPVVDRHSRKVLGLVAVEDLLQARSRSWERETKQVRIRRVAMPFLGPRRETVPSEVVESEMGETLSR